MDLVDVQRHWEDWARTYGTDPRATDKSKTRKWLEIDALRRAILHGRRDTVGPATVLEVGCGTGYNCLAVAQSFPEFRVYGVDLVSEMVANARLLLEQSGLGNVEYFEGDLLQLAALRLPVDTFDIVFTNRCLINLNTDALQRAAITTLAARVSPGGLLILVENPSDKFDRQNMCRAAVGLPPRTPPDFNRLIDEESCLAAARAAGVALVYVDDFSSLHDTLLYVLLPAINGGTIDYDHPILEPAADLCRQAFQIERNVFGSFGQNRLYLFKKP
jgi:SAM-dependent methyltransferase